MSNYLMKRTFRSNLKIVSNTLHEQKLGHYTGTYTGGFHSMCYQGGMVGQWLAHLPYRAGILIQIHVFM